MHQPVQEVFVFHGGPYSSPTSTSTSSSASSTDRQTRPRRSVQQLRRGKTYGGEGARERDLLALHRESCLLFTAPPPLSTSPPPPLSTTPPPQLPTTPPPPSLITSPPSTKEMVATESEAGRVQPTVIDWTSPSTRRREYAEIDRASRGLRGAWRKFAPGWCQSKDARVPFFTAGDIKDDGSVRRFRMHVPGDSECADRRRGVMARLTRRTSSFT